MRRKMTGIMIVLVVAICLGAVGGRALAYPPCGPYQEPLSNDSGSFCRPMYFGYELVHLTSGVPFAWIRSAPSSDAPILTTIYPTSYASMKLIYANERYTAWDGFQNWYQVHPYPVDTGVVGWVEQASITSAAYSGYPPENPAELAQWTVPQTGTVKPGVPFLWIRSAAASDAGIVATIPAGGTLTIAGSPTFDGVQWWWKVDYSSRSGIQHGYVEQALIIASDGPIQSMQ
jgi:hypothetical protein